MPRIEYIIENITFIQVEKQNDYVNMSHNICSIYIKLAKLAIKCPSTNCYC